ncbi:MAG: DUF433 domain-containing protein [Pikeienuella sp.]|uniref:DUF433 domain-containing protein n=1 Tax=Pikeienuella sp. TaxID=2831957 RepID=UPI00391958EE
MDEFALWRLTAQNDSTLHLRRGFLPFVLFMASGKGLKGLVMGNERSIDWRSAIRAGVYPVAFTAKMAGLPASTVTSWFRKTGGGRLPPAILTPFDEMDGPLLVPFLGLVEARFVAHFRMHGLSLQTIRKVAGKLRADYHFDHPFAKGRFRTDGKNVMMEFAADDGERRLLDIMTDELAFPSVVEPSLFDTVVYIEDVAATLHPLGEFPRVVIDPRFAFGRPVVENGHVPTETLAAAFLAEGNVEAVADWHGTDVESVTQAIGFEQRIAA